MELACRIIFWVLFFTGLPGNIIIMAAFGIKAKKKSTDMIIMIQALVDLIACITPQPDMIKNVSSCLVTAIIRQTTSLGSLFLTFAIAVDRYVTVCRPFSRKMNKTHAIILASVCVAFAFLLNLSSVWHFKVLDVGSNGCMSVVTSPLHNSIKVIQLVSFLVAVAVSLYSYTKIYTLIRRQARVRSEMGAGLPNKASGMTTVSASVAESVRPTRPAWNSDWASVAATEGRSTLKTDNVESQDSGYLEVPHRWLGKLSVVRTVSDTSDQRSCGTDVSTSDRIERPGNSCQDQSFSSKIKFKKQSQGNVKTTRPHRRTSGDKTTKMLLVITIFLILSWLPYVVIFSLSAEAYLYLVTEIINKHNVFFLTRIRGFNHMINAFVYWAVNPLFRADVKQVFIRLNNLKNR